MAFKIGMGYDIHRLVSGRPLILGGVKIPYAKGLLGHSDADVLTHAICDALLGAMGEKDIGELFSDNNPKYKDALSTDLLKIVLKLVTKKGCRISNIDTVIIAQEPKLTPFKRKIQDNLSGILKIKKDCLGIKAKTNEGLGEIGAKGAIACYACVLLKKRGD